jgi:hypothetical protein
MVKRINNIKEPFGGNESVLLIILVQAHIEIHIGGIMTNNQIKINIYSNLSQKVKWTILSIIKVGQGSCSITS